MTSKDLEDTTPPKIVKGTDFHVCHSFITTLAFLSSDGEASWLLLPSLVSLLLGSTVQPDNTYSCIQGLSK